MSLVGDVGEEQSRRLCSSVRRENGESKVVIICRTAEQATRLGTSLRPVTLDSLRRPELWYFFRVLAFGGADPEDRPEMVAIAAEIFVGIHPFALLAAFLRADMTLCSWRQIARVLGEAGRLQLGGAYGGREQ
ncbi:hypothetical protein E2562_020658 [Oryza meyeriana var. granulata]|uniref:NB-ARC domain-containing protein n=1 Tax=Oryza meyeriana var. granulata TaxID=110450 RepID=A0A6G1EC26_9ORYZ|nr:hypothetical protein E2562_020658 [Oryza meyeriana var. granulata]